jgi:hypothetical protein
MKPAFLALIALAAGAAPSWAETRAERTACTPDVLRLCASQIPDAAAITACLRVKRASLSGGCRMVMDETDSAARNVASRR